MYIHQTMIRVRYGETDAMGFVYYGNYSLYYEQGRTEAIRALGISYYALEQMGFSMPVAEMKIRYILPAKYDDMLRVETIIPEMPTRKMCFRMRIYNQENRLINSAETILLFIDRQYERSTHPPKELTDLLLPFFVDHSGGRDD